jgi:hypothetical protein
MSCLSSVIVTVISIPPGMGLEFDRGIVGQKEMDVKKKFQFGVWEEWSGV